MHVSGDAGITNMWTYEYQLNLLLLAHLCSSRMCWLLLGTLLLTSGHPQNIWHFSWLSIGSACVTTPTIYNWDFIAKTSDVMQWTGFTSKSSFSAASPLSGLTQLRTSALTLSLPYRYVSSASYFASWSKSCWSWGLAATIDFLQIGINGLWSVCTLTLLPKV